MPITDPLPTAHDPRQRGRSFINRVEFNSARATEDAGSVPCPIPAWDPAARDPRAHERRPRSPWCFFQEVSRECGDSLRIFAVYSKALTTTRTKGRDGPEAAGGGPTGAVTLRCSEDQGRRSADGHMPRRERYTFAARHIRDQETFLTRSPS